MYTFKELADTTVGAGKSESWRAGQQAGDVGLEAEFLLLQEISASALKAF